MRAGSPVVVDCRAVAVAGSIPRLVASNAVFRELRLGEFGGWPKYVKRLPDSYAAMVHRPQIREAGACRPQGRDRPEATLRYGFCFSGRAAPRIGALFSQVEAAAEAWHDSGIPEHHAVK
jgi:hypothetical protein